MADRPNILLITTDQQRFDTISALGNDTIYTPHLDWLVRNGWHFNRCYSAAPICVPARHTIMTGLDGQTTGRHHMGGWGDEPSALHPTIPGLLTQNGYQTHAYGKMHFNPMRAHFGFEHIELPADYMRTMAKHPELGIPMDHGIGQNESVPVFSTVPDSHSLTHWTVDRSINFLETRDESRPFFMWTSFTKPHAPYDCSKEYWDLYDGAPIPDAVFGDWSEKAEDIPDGWLESTWMLNNTGELPEHKRKAMKRAYYGCISQVDYNLGLLFARMNEMKLLENTWIIFTADHGDMLGDHHMGAKHCHLEGSSHIPMLIRPPGPLWDIDNEQRQGGSDAICCLADILPTCLGIAGVELPEHDGQDLRHLMDQSSDAREHLYCRCQEYHAVITATHKYHFMGLGGDELFFDISQDPMEQRNLIGTGEAEEELNRLRAIVAENIREQGEDNADGDKPVSKKEPRDKASAHRTLMPGHHSRLFPCDVLH